MNKLMTFSLCAGALSLHSGLVAAGPFCWSDEDLSYVVTLSAGPAANSSGTATQTFFLTPGIENSYVGANKLSLLGIGELFLGLSKQFGQCSSAQLGLALLYASNASITGNILDNADPKLDNSTYNYKVQHTHLAIKAKWLFEPPSKTLNYYLSGSAGYGKNAASNYTITSKHPSLIPEFIFTNASTSSLAFTLGAGIQYPVSENWELGLGYEFAYWGKSQLGSAPNQTVNTGLSLSTLYTNAIMFGLNYSC